MKLCSRCNIIKDRESFHKRTRSKDGLYPWCKGCYKEYYSENKGAISKRKNCFRIVNKERINKEKREYYSENKELIALRKKESYKRCHERICSTRRKYYARNREACLSSSKRYATKNAELLKEKANSRRRHRFLTDPGFRALYAARRRIRAALKGQDKSARTLALLGIDGAGFMQYLESKFKKGMTRDNYGKVWHVDHIIPLALFDLSKPAEQRVAFHFTNCQPLFAEENLKKGAKILK